MSEEAEAALEGLAQALERTSPRLSTLDALVLAALAQDLAADSRSLARIFGIGHALVLRTIVALAEEPALLTITRREARTQRSILELTEVGQVLVAATRRA